MVVKPSWLKAWAAEAGISWRGLRGPEPLDLSRAATRWALARAGGCAGDTAEITGWYDGRTSTTYKPGVVPAEAAPFVQAVHGFADTRRADRACTRGICTCLRLGCDVQGACLGDTMLQ